MNLYVSVSIFKVCFGDVSESVTLPVYNELVELYGEPNVIHGQCDVRDAKQVKGKATSKHKAMNQCWHNVGLTS